MLIFFLENWQFNHKLALPLTHLTHIPCLKDFPHNLRKYEMKGASKIPISQFFSELEKIWE